MSLPVSVPLDYVKASSGILAVNVDSQTAKIEDLAFRIFGNPLNMSLKISNNSIRYVPYCELLFPVTGSSQYNVYSNFDCQNTFNTNDGSQLKISSDNVVVNDKRFWTMDQLVQVSGSAPDGVNMYIKVPFKNNKKIEASFKWTAQLEPGSGKPYTVSQISRQTIWEYNPQTPVYLLINTRKHSLSIYVMQSYTNQVYEDLSPANLPYLGGRMHVDEGWTFAYMILDQTTKLRVISTETAYLVQDAAKNSYQYLDPLYAPWLYEKYAVTV
jgi:hypothetical protein